MCQPEPKKRKPSLRALLTNLQSDMPWQQKIKFFLQNNWIKIKNFQDCCGHPGEPGC